MKQIKTGVRFHAIGSTLSICVSVVVLSVIMPTVESALTLHVVKLLMEGSCRLRKHESQIQPEYKDVFPWVSEQQSTRCCGWDCSNCGEMPSEWKSAEMSGKMGRLELSGAPDSTSAGSSSLTHTPIEWCWTHRMFCLLRSVSERLRTSSHLHHFYLHV